MAKLSIKNPAQAKVFVGAKDTQRTPQNPNYSSTSFSSYFYPTVEKEVLPLVFPLGNHSPRGGNSLRSLLSSRPPSRRAAGQARKKGQFPPFWAVGHAAGRPPLRLAPPPWHAAAWPGDRIAAPQGEPSEPGAPPPSIFSSAAGKSPLGRAPAQRAQ